VAQPQVTWPPDMEVSCEYIAGVMDSKQGMVLQGGC